MSLISICYSICVHLCSEQGMQLEDFVSLACTDLLRYLHILVYTLQGTQIEASVWRDLADRYYDLLEEGKASSYPCTVIDFAAGLLRYAHPLS